MSTIRLAVAGYGYIAHYHARGIANAPGAELVAVLGRDEEKRVAFAEQHGARRHCETAEELFATGDVDALVIALPNSFHAPLAHAAFDAGAHVLVEKPMAMNATEAHAMVSAAAVADRRLLVGHMWRFDPQAIAIRDAVVGGEIGSVVKTKSYGIHVNWGPAGWFVDPALAGGGALIDMGVHAIDTTRFILGDPKPVRVYARIETRFGDYAVDDFGVIVIDWDNEVTSIIESGWWNPHMDGPEASTQVFGTRGYARLFPNEITRIRHGQPTTETLEFPPRAEHCDQAIFDAQMAAFVSSIRQGSDTIADGPAGATVLEICDAAYRSAREHVVVNLDGSSSAGR